ncbi:protein PIMREG [Tiliqua scincoides]|uniref:protein PIMREG n=1 Tax=Tiliqua scincoides TaxID=71010 RepID=UPI003461E85D
MASVLQSMESAVGWRSHKILSELEDSPLPDRFKKKSSCNLSTLRMSLRKRMPLKEVEINFNENPTWESLEAKEKSQSLQALTRMATNVLGTVSQKIQKSCHGPTRSLMTSLASVGNTGCSTKTKGSSPRTPRRKSKRLTAASTPVSATKILTPSGQRSSTQPGSHRFKREALQLRRSRRAAALRSPYGSPASAGRQRQLDCDLELVSTGIRQLKRLSRAFNDIIVQEERDQAITNYYQVMARNMQSARLRSRNLSRFLRKRQAAQLQRTLGGWAKHHLKQY